LRVFNQELISILELRLFLRAAIREGACILKGNHDRRDKREKQVCPVHKIEVGMLS
jgi:hypothetical protein